MQTEQIFLTQYSHGAGCGCKIAPAVLEEILKTTHDTGPFPSLLVGNSSKDDAAVYDLGNGTSIISTTDFFTPIVDDAFDFGRIASANAISDIYAMGGTPLLAIAILGWPIETLPASLAQKVLDGARAVCKEANIPLAGGHSIDSKEPFFGLAVNGLVLNHQLKKNNTAKNGDVLLLTKPIGVGVLSTAQKRKVLQPQDEGIATKWMSQLNKEGAAFAALDAVHALTDVTGFGLLGHLLEMAEGSGLSAEINYSSIPVIEESKKYVAQRIVPDATYRNWNSYSNKVGFESGVNVMEAFSLLPDPQTNGGLLLAVSPDKVNDIKNIISTAVEIGKLVPQQEKMIKVLP